MAHRAHRLTLSGLLLLTSCSGGQHVLDPYGPAAGSIADIAWLLFAGAAVIWFVVMALIGYALLAHPDRRRRITGTQFVVGGGIVFPSVTLGALLTYTVWVGSDLTARPEQPPLRIEVVGHMWWWEVRYPDHGITTANELHIPVGRPVEVLVTTADVIHSFWVPNLAGKIDMIPGHPNRLTFTADRPGMVRGQCAEFCGLQHTLMAFMVVIVPPEDFEAWLDRERRPALDPPTPLLAQGRDAFTGAECGRCHTIRGVPGAEGRKGPDLTHVGSRRTLAAGTLGNGTGNLAGWIAGSQHIKPGNHMPSFPLDGPTLRALAAYLESLE